jgi:hypothetical protein
MWQNLIGEAFKARQGVKHEYLGGVGDANTRKTSTIRALTGVGRIQRHWDISYEERGPAPTYVHPPGLQEIDISPEDFVRQVDGAAVEHVIVALRYDQTRGYPDAAEYFRAFRRAGWNVAGHAVLGRDTALPGFGQGIAVPNAPTLPPNEIADQLRAAWGIC